jgi:Pentapeptide repeats (8 copies)
MIDKKDVTKENVRQYLEENRGKLINLSDAYLSDANLSDANLSDANLSGAYLIGANLRDANLSDANLSGAYLIGANLRDANLRDANLSDANLSDANLSGAYLRGAKILDSNRNEITLKKAHDFRNLYKYSCILFIAENNDIYIKMGCFTRKKEDWETDFHNNNSEFPEGAQQTLLRKNALDFIINYAKIMGYCDV